MRPRCWMGVFCVLAATTVPVQAQVNLEWKLKKGDRFYLQTETTSKQVMELPGKEVGKEIKQDVSRTSVLQFQVEDKTSEGNYIIKQTVEGMMVKTGADSSVTDEKIQGAT